VTGLAGADRGVDADRRAFGQMVFDTSKPDGTPRKLLDVSRLQDLRWQAKTGLRERISMTYAGFPAKCFQCLLILRVHNNLTSLALPAFLATRVASRP
jgi:hypothetical protein